MNEKRDRIQIIHDILISIQEKNGLIKPTHLLYKSNLSHDRLKKYVNELIESGMIKEELHSGKKHYKLTEKGFKFIFEYKRIKEFTETFGI